MNATKLSPDVGTISALLEIEADRLADIFRHEVGRLMRVAAQRIEDGVDMAHDPITSEITHLWLLVEVCETEWAETHGDPDDDYIESERELRQSEGDRATLVGGTEATPRTPGETPPQSRDDMVSESMRALGGET